MKGVRIVARLLFIAMLTFGAVASPAGSPALPQRWLDAHAVQHNHDEAASSDTLVDEGGRHSHDFSVPDHVHEAVVPDVSRPPTQPPIRLLREALRTEALPLELRAGLERPPRF